MSVFVKITVTIICAVVPMFVVWRFILPLGALYLAGVGVEIPFSKRFVMAHPKLAIYLFVVGGPLLFLALVTSFI